jgi:hypothetical protein
MYGLFTAVCALGLLQFDTINRNDRPSGQSLALNWLIHCAIVLTHLYGAFYSGAILIAFVIRDRYFGMLRTKVYLSVLLSWLVLFMLAPVLINQSNNSARWFIRLGFSQTINLLIPFPRFYWFVLAILLVSALVYLAQRNRQIAITKDESQLKSEAGLLIFAVLLMMVPFIAWFITMTIKPMLDDKYILPTITLGWPILLTYLIARLLPDGFRDTTEKRSDATALDPHKIRKMILVAITAILLAGPIYYAFALKTLPKPGADDVAFGYNDLPIAMEAGHDFLPRFFYSSKPSRYFHILDWETAVNNLTSIIATGDYVHLKAISRQYPFIQSVESDDFLKRHDRFLVLNEGDQYPFAGKWFEARIKSNPGYEVKRLGTVSGVWGPLEVFLVERKGQ